DTIIVFQLDENKNRGVKFVYLVKEKAALNGSSFHCDFGIASLKVRSEKVSRFGVVSSYPVSRVVQVMPSCSKGKVRVTSLNELSLIVRVRGAYKPKTRPPISQPRCVQTLFRTRSNDWTGCPIGNIISLYRESTLCRTDNKGDYLDSRFSRRWELLELRGAREKEKTLEFLVCLLLHSLLHFITAIYQRSYLWLQRTSSRASYLIRTLQVQLSSWRIETRNSNGIEDCLGTQEEKGRRANETFKILQRSNACYSDYNAQVRFQDVADVSRSPQKTEIIIPVERPIGIFRERDVIDHSDISIDAQNLTDSPWFLAYKSDRIPPGARKPHSLT
ncbi:hypothetical protein V1478_002983, partial [Vespula squamosa]